jgi:hypothetical protein
MYEIIYSDGFNILFRHWIGNDEAQYEVKHFFENALSSHPDSGQLVPGTFLWAITLATLPPVTFYYGIDEEARALTLYYLAEH